MRRQEKTIQCIVKTTNNTKLERMPFIATKIIFQNFNNILSLFVKPLTPVLTAVTGIQKYFR